MTTYTVLIILSSLVIFSYLFDIFARRTKFPAVPLLLLTGIGLRLLSDFLQWPTINLLAILPAIGTVGLILIVFEASLELRYERQKNILVLKAFMSALVILLVTTAAIAYIHHNLTGSAWRLCIINSIPYGIISSAIAIPSTAHFSMDKKEFIVYESTFSDILGILLFSFMLNNEMITGVSMLILARDSFMVLMISAAFCLLLLFLIGRLRHPVKFFLILSILVLVYGIGRLLDLPSLIIVLIFGIFLNNADQIRVESFRNYFLYPSFKADLHQLTQISKESAFLIRTFFFIIFGFIINVDSLGNWDIINYGIIILITIYFVRAIYLRFFEKSGYLIPLLVTPRGLISILLFLSIPEELRISESGTGLLFLVVLATSLVMTVGLLVSRKFTQEQADLP